LKRGDRYLLLATILTFALWIGLFNPNRNLIAQNQNTTTADSAQNTDTTHLIYPFNDFSGNPYMEQNSSPFFLNNPSNVKQEIIYNPKTNTYEFVNKVGNFTYRSPTSMDFKEFQKYDLNKDVKSYWKDRSQVVGTSEGERLIPKIYVGGKAFESIFGSNTIDIRPQGSAQISFGILSNKRDDPALDVRQRRTTNFDFKETIQMNVIAKIGDKIEFKANYNTESSFNFENTLKLKYEGKEDEIIQLIEAGNVSLPLRSTLIRGSQSLFGVKTKLQFGKTTITGVFSQQQSESKNIRVQGGAQANHFEFSALDYEDNRHFFLSQYFRDNYERALSSLPFITSDVVISKVEVWVTNIGAATEENRNIVAFTDLGENNPSKIYNPLVQPVPGQNYPSNVSNDLLYKLDTNQIRNINDVTKYLTGDPFNIGQSGYITSGEDFIKLENARKLKSTEYKFNPKLGFISLNTSLSDDQIVAVSYQYSIIGDSRVYQVGEFSDQGIVPPNSLIVKLLKSNVLNTDMPMWDLMMKNVYSIGAYQIQRDDFIFNILYSGDKNGVPTGYFMEGPDDVKGKPLIHVLGVDNLDNQLNPIPGGDGVFDFIDGAATNGGTFQGSNGRIYFPVLEPFGSYIHDSVFPSNPALADKYSFDSLYSMTKTAAEQFPDKNRYLLEGFYKSKSGSEISLNALNVPQGSVTVTAGGVPLVENVDYTVDYTLGRVRILNDGILSSGTPINVSLESNSMFNVQQKRMMGIHVDHEVNKDLHIGGTLLNLHERPLTQKVNYGDDPISNTIWGVDLSYHKDSRWLTNVIDKLPGISTNVVSKITVNAEFAQFLPGHSKAIGQSGTSYIDDFEGAKSTIDLKHTGSWFIASTPQGQPSLFPEGGMQDYSYGKNRAKFAWYIIDPLFYDRTGGLRPTNVDKNEISKNSTRQILETEVFPNKDIPNGRPTTIPTLNMAYFPDERGPYNFDADNVSPDGKLLNPETRWGGMMRKIETSDFEAANIEYIEFWMMDPFSEDPDNKGDMYINLGEVSEDILKDGRKSYENGLPTSAAIENVDTTLWGRVPTVQALVESFSNVAGSRQFQDVGYDGLGDDDEKSFYQTIYLEKLRQNVGSNSKAYQLAEADPSSDDYHYFRGSDYDQEGEYSSITERYKDFNGVEGNSPTDDLNPEQYPTSNSNIPNVEDINRDNTLSESERYFQYKIKLDPNEMEVGKNNIADIRTARNVSLANGDILPEVKWYQFRIPITNPSKVVGRITDFRSIRFMRVFMKDFQKPIVCRFATFELVRGDWRRYQHSLLAQGEYIPSDDGSETKYVISTVNIEENGRRVPIPYVIPPGIRRESNFATTDYVKLNEQSLQFSIDDLQDGDARGAYKTTEFDFRQYKKIKMFVHGEKKLEEQVLNDNDMTIFVRVGADFTNNYYEYEIPIKITPWGTTINQPDLIWPEDNNMEIVLDEMVKVKQDRNVAMRDPNNTLSLTKPYREIHGKATITVLGNPNISDVKGILIGVRNPKKLGFATSDDGEAKSAIIWVDELRLTDFNDSPGWATTGRVQADLADLGRVSLLASHRAAGFGTIDQKISEIPLDYETNIQISTDLSLGKFFGKKSGIRIPMHYDYGIQTITPKYNPLNPDILLKDDLDTYTTKSSRDSVKALTIDHTTRQNINFMNVRKDKTNSRRKSRIYDIENFNGSFAYSQINHQNIDIEEEVQKKYQGGLGYNYSTSPKNVKPFNKITFLGKSKWFKLIKDFNFYYLPKIISFRTDMNRNFMKKQYRDKSFGDIITYPTYNRVWNWNNNFNLKYDLAKSLTFELSTGSRAYIKEPTIYPDKETQQWEEYKQEVWSQIRQFGTKQNYNQTFKATYNVPLKKIPLVDWVKLTASYQALFTWTASPISIQQRFGNTLENSNDIQLNSGADLNKLYNKVPYFKKLNRSNNRRSSRGRGNNGNARGKQKAAKTNPDDSTNAKPKVNYGKIALDGFLKTIMVVKKVSLNYRTADGTLLPGYIPEPTFLGMNMAENAPGWDFVFGSQRDIRGDAARMGWITTDTALNNPYIKKHSEQLNYKANLDLWSVIRIDLSGDRVLTSSRRSYYRYNNDIGGFYDFSPIEKGNFSISYNLIRTSFSSKGDSTNSPVFNQFRDNRLSVAERLANQNPNWNHEYFYDSLAGTNFPQGYGSNQQEVLYYAFLAAYGGKDANKIDVSSIFPTFPFPNWNITFSGLTNIGFIGKIFRSFNIKHSYRSMMTIASWQQNLLYNPNDPGQMYENSMNFVNKYDAGVVAMMETFSPLIGFDVTMQNSFNARLDYKKSRSITMSFVNNQMTEVNSSEISVGVGYRFKNIKFSVITGGKKNSFNSDLNIKADFGIRDNITFLRRIDDDNNQISAGAKQFTFNFTADYMLSKSLQLRFYYSWNNNTPYISAQYPTASTSGGFSLRFNLAQ